MRRAATLLIGWLALVGCAKTTTVRLGLPELRTVSRVDLRQYVGTWYDIASFPQRFQRGCTGPTARPTMDSTVYEGILGWLRAQGYEVARLERTPQSVDGS